jgi:hypothetical protein
MTNDTPRWTLPLLAAGQAQKEMTHNEALSLLDLVVHPCVEAVGVNAPPGNPLPGQAWIVGDQPVGDWTGRAGMLAGWSEGGWRFLVPRIGLSAWSRADDCRCDWDGLQWRLGRIAGRSVIIEGKKVVGPQRPGIAPPAGGQVIDSEARLALDAVILALREHGLVASG